MVEEVRERRSGTFKSLHAGQTCREEDLNIKVETIGGMIRYLRIALTIVICGRSNARWTHEDPQFPTGAVTLLAREFTSSGIVTVASTILNNDNSLDGIILGVAHRQMNLSRRVLAFGDETIRV